MADPVDPVDDDDAAAEWSDDDTDVALDPSDLLELEADARTPTRTPESLPGYELGRRDERMAFFAAWDALLAEERRRGAAAVLQALRDELERQTHDPGFVEEFVRRLAQRAGVALG